MTQSKRQDTTIIITMFLATFMAAVEGTIVTTALPQIISKLGDLALFPWVNGIYCFSQAITLPLYGVMADAYGRKWVFLASTVIFLSGSILCGYAGNIEMLIVFRGLQGLGAGGLVPVALTIIADLSDPVDRPRMLSYVSVVWGISAVIGPLASTLILKGPGWPFVFWINVPIAAAVLTSTILYLDEDRKEATEIAWLNFLSLATSLASLMAVTTAYRNISKNTSFILITGSISLLIAFIRRERENKNPIFAGHLLRQRMVCVSLISAFLCGALLLGSTNFLPIWVVGVAHGDSSTAGQTVGALTLSWTVANVIVSRMMNRCERRYVAIISACILIVGFGALLVLGRHPATLYVISAATIIGIGLGINTLVFTLTIQSVVGIAERGRATAMFFFFRLMGQATSASVAGALMDFGLESRDVSPFATSSFDNLNLAMGVQRVFTFLVSITILMLLTSLCVPNRSSIQ